MYSIRSMDTRAWAESMSDRLFARPATAVVDLLRSGTASPREVLAEIESRVAEVNPAVNALVTLCFDRARDHARALEEKPSAERGVLAGLPIPIKDAYAVEGVRTTIGSLAFADPAVVRVTVRSMKPDIYPDARIGCEIVRTR